MKFVRLFCWSVLFFFPVCVLAQATYLPRNERMYHTIDRLEIKLQKNTNLNYSTLKPYNRQYVVKEMQFLDSALTGYTDSLGQDIFKGWTDFDITPVDSANLMFVYRNNSEWTTNPTSDYYASKRPLFKTLYKTKANMLEVNTPNFFMALNPLLNFTKTFDRNDKNENLFINSRGLSVRGLIAKKVGFYAMVTDNQERPPKFAQSYFNNSYAVPGVGFYKVFKKTGYDYIDARGYFTFSAIKNIMTFQVGYDKNFIGNGFRSLFLSDWGNSYTQIKINTRIWKLNYQNIFMELMPQFIKTRDTLLDRKYAAMHHLSMNVTKWLNLGLFEGVVFGRKNHFDFSYMNPIIFYRYVEGNNGSPDNSVIGFDFKANVKHRAQVYGQFLLDEFILSDFKAGKGSWTNKYGVQFGVKYIDAFGAKNLDLQAEVNRIRPFTYSHYDSIANYTHYNQPLAHPLGANVNEFVGIVRYQPTYKLSFYGRAIYYYKGLDSAGINFGGNIFEDYRTRTKDTGFYIGSGNKLTVLNLLLVGSYMFKDNLYLDVSAQYRKAKILVGARQKPDLLFSIGLRLNLERRDYDF